MSKSRDSATPSVRSRDWELAHDLKLGKSGDGAERAHDAECAQRGEVARIRDQDLDHACQSCPCFSADTHRLVFIV